MDKNLFKKYNVPGPRYTSYPTVPYWDNTPSSDAWIKSIQTALNTSQVTESSRAAVYVHIPFCENLCTYCGCNTRITHNHAVAKPYIETILKEWKLYRTALAGQIPISEIHLGGGTPTFLSPSEIVTLVTGLLELSTPVHELECSVEADPRVTTEEHFNVLSQLGFRRLSLGIQDFDPRVQEAVHRVQTEDQVEKLVKAARDLNFTSINFDLIYGLPFQNIQSIEKTIRAVERIRPDRIAFYAYAHVPWIKPSQRRFTEADLPSGDEKRALYEHGRQMLEASGYFEIGMDHFALKSDSLWKATQVKSLHRNFMGYINRNVSPLIGLGVSAIGDSWTAFSQNEKQLEKYQERVHKGEFPILRGHVLTQEDLVLRRHVLNLMTKFETAWHENGQIDYLLTVPEKLRELEADGLVTLGAQSCQITNHGRPFLRNICMAFDARLTRAQPSTKIFSQTI